MIEFNYFFSSIFICYSMPLHDHHFFKTTLLKFHNETLNSSPIMGLLQHLPLVIRLSLDLQQPDCQNSQIIPITYNYFISRVNKISRNCLTDLRKHPYPLGLPVNLSQRMVTLLMVPHPLKCCSSSLAVEL